MKLLFFCLLCLHISESLKKDGSNVYLLNLGNLEVSVKNLDSLLVVFFSPKCQSCRALEDILPKIVHDLELKGTPISVGKIDISQSREDHPILVKRYQIHHLPTLRFFVAGGVVKYQGPLQVTSITGWLTKVCSNPEKFTRTLDNMVRR